MTEKLLLRPMEAADLAGVGRSKSYKLIASGEVPAVRLGRRSLRVPVDGLRQWIRRLGSVATLHEPSDNHTGSPD